MHLLFILLMSLPFTTPLSAQDEILDSPPPAALRECPFFHQTSPDILLFDLPDRPAAPPVKEDLIYLTPERVTEDLEDLQAIGRGHGEEIQGWQKLERYFKEIETLARSHRRLHNAYQEDRNLSPLYSSIRSIFHNYTNHLRLNRLMLFEKAVDSLLACRQLRNAPVQSLTTLKAVVIEEIAVARHNQNPQNVYNSRSLPFGENLIPVYNNLCLDINFIDHYNDGRPVNLDKIP